MGLARGCLRCIIGITNVILLLIGIIFLGSGIFMLTALPGLVNDFLQPSLDGFKNVAKELDYPDNTEGDEIDIKPLIEPIAICLIVIGIILLIVSVLGILGACCNSRLLLAVYAIVLVVVIIVQLILVILFFSKALDDRIRDEMETKLIEPYKGLDDFSASSLVVNVIMFGYQCCGIDSYEDFSMAKEWQKSYKASQNNYTREVNLQTPIACCKSDSAEDGDGGRPTGKGVEKNCAEHPTDTNSNWNTGCWDKVTAELDGYRTNAIVVIVILLIVQVVIFIMAVAVVCLLKDNATDIL